MWTFTLSSGHFLSVVVIQFQLLSCDVSDCHLVSVVVCNVSDCHSVSVVVIQCSLLS